MTEVEPLLESQTPRIPMEPLISLNNSSSVITPKLRSNSKDRITPPPSKQISEKETDMHDTMENDADGMEAEQEFSFAVTQPDSETKSEGGRDFEVNQGDEMMIEDPHENMEAEDCPGDESGLSHPHTFNEEEGKLIL